MRLLALRVVGVTLELRSLSEAVPPHPTKNPNRKLLCDLSTLAVVLYKRLLSVSRNVSGDVHSTSSLHGGAATLLEILKLMIARNYPTSYILKHALGLGHGSASAFVLGIPSRLAFLLPWWHFHPGFGRPFAYTW